MDRATSQQNVTERAAGVAPPDDSKSDPGSRPGRSTRGNIPVRYRDTQEFENMSTLETMQYTYAAGLQRLCEKAKQAVLDRRSKSTLSTYDESIRDSFAVLSQANILHINSLNLPSLKEVAIQWMQDRQSEVDEVLHELRIALRSGSILSRSVSEYSQRSLNSSNRQLELEAEQAALELKQAKRRAGVNRQLADWEAEKLKQKAELMAQEEVEKAQLKARGLQTLAEAALHHEDEGMAVLPDEADVKQSEQVNKWLLEQTVDPQVRPKTDKLPWLIPETDQASPESFQAQRAQDQVVNSGDSKARQKCDIQSTNMNNAVPLVSVSGRHPGYHGGTHTMQAQGQQLPVTSNRKQMPGTSSIAMNVESEPIDAWIDELIPGVETVHDNSSPSTDYLREAIVKLESERDLPAVDLPTFSGAALEWPRFIEQLTVATGTFGGISQCAHPHLEHTKGLNIQDVAPGQVQVLIGISTPRAHIQTEIRVSKEHQPIAVHTALGWTLMGGAVQEQVEAKINFTVAQDRLLSLQIEQFWSTESLGVAYTDKSSLSIEDRRAQTVLDNTTRLVDGHYEVGMLWRDSTKLPNNYSVAQQRFHSLLKRLRRGGEFESTYSRTMNDYISKGYARKLDEQGVERNTLHTWYLPHHGVTNPNKPGRVRVVFDAAAVHSNTSLNANLLTGPDLLNSLFGVLQRFRLHSVALVADVEAMFHQVNVPEMDSDALRFPWKEDINEPGPPEVYKMLVHIFGAKDSPCCANYAVKRTARDNADSFSSQAVEAVLTDFYVDDLVKSVETVDEAVSLAKELPELLSKGGFHLHKWLSNSVEVLESVTEGECGVEIVDMDLDDLPVQRALGLRWNVAEDSFVFSPKKKDVPQTKRGVVSFVSSIFDPCGFVAPYTLRAKCLIQELWRRNVDWDESLPQEVQPRWKSWLEEVDELCHFKLPRYHVGLTSDTQWMEIHMFCDASELAFGAVGYLRYAVADNKVANAFLAAKTHVAPVKGALSIPRLELQGALLAVRLRNTLVSQLKIPSRRSVFWSDSSTVLCYLNNENKRFKPFVSNRVSEILETSEPSQWRYVPSELNTADYCTRGLPTAALTSDHPWFSGPEFLLQEEDKWPSDFPKHKGNQMMTIQK